MHGGTFMLAAKCRYVAAKTPFFRDSIHLPDLQNRLGVLIDWCDEFIPKLVPGATPQTPASQVNRFYGYSFGGPGQQNPSMLEQCVVEQKWMRESMLRSLLYNQVHARPCPHAGQPFTSSLCP